MKFVRFLGLTLACALLCVAASAQSTINIAVDENGNCWMNGNTVPWFVGQDIGPGGLANALNYDFGSFGLTWTVGDLALQVPSGTSGSSEVIRFNPNGTLVFYSDIEVGTNTLADVDLPTLRYENNLTRTELGNDISNGIFYVPTEGSNPGYAPGLQVEYHITSESTVPEPSSLLALLCGVSGLGGLIGRRRR